MHPSLKKNLMLTARTFAGEEAAHGPENKQTGPGLVRSTKRFFERNVVLPNRTGSVRQLYRVGCRSVRRYLRSKRRTNKKRPGTYATRRVSETLPWAGFELGRNQLTASQADKP